jgi:hypothetical protein
MASARLCGKDTRRLLGEPLLEIKLYASVHTPGVLERLGYGGAHMEGKGMGAEEHLLAFGRVHLELVHPAGQCRCAMT